MRSHVFLELEKGNTDDSQSAESVPAGTDSGVCKALSSCRDKFGISSGRQHYGVLVFYGIYLAAVEKVDLSFKAYLNNLKLLLGVTLVAFLMNSVLEQYKTNFLFLRVPPMDNLPLLNLNNGWYVYFLTLAAVACILVLLVQLPFMILSARNKKRSETDI